jgi:hypothetical protein
MKGTISVPVVFTIILLAGNNTRSANPDSSCLKEESKDDKSELKNTKKDEQESKSQISNGVCLKTEGGVEISKAFLSYEGGDICSLT